MTDKPVNENVEVVILPGKASSSADRTRIRNVVRDNLLLPSSEPYHKVQVEVNRRPDGSPVSLVATMLRAKTYTADLVTVNVDKNFNVTSIKRM
ncbi:MAG: hypothetical protein WC367_00490 [Methanoregula sp.]|jgi:hypothetical protein